MTARLVPAVHSTLAAFPAAGFMLDIGGTRVYISGDTDLYGDMKTIGERYQPNLAIVTVGNGPFTMGPEEAARACQWLGVSHAIPVHYAHNPLVRGVEAGEEFRKAQLANEDIRRIPVVVVSARYDANAIAKRMRAAACLTKPLDFNELARVCKRFVS